MNSTMLEEFSFPINNTSRMLQFEKKTKMLPNGALGIRGHYD